MISNTHSHYSARLSPLMVIALLATMLACCAALAQVPYDLSKAVEYKTVWQMDYPGTVWDRLIS